MTDPYLTVTLELSGADELAVMAIHDNLRDLLRCWRRDVQYGALTVQYQDQAQLDQDAQVEGGRSVREGCEEEDDC